VCVGILGCCNAVPKTHAFNRQTHNYTEQRSKVRRSADHVLSAIHRRLLCLLLRSGELQAVFGMVWSLHSTTPCPVITRCFILPKKVTFRHTFRVETLMCLWRTQPMTHHCTAVVPGRAVETNPTSLLLFLGFPK
jgi:hypothetical protein